MPGVKEWTQQLDYCWPVSSAYESCVLALHSLHDTHWAHTCCMMRASRQLPGAQTRAMVLRQQLLLFSAVGGDTGA